MRTAIFCVYFITSLKLFSGEIESSTVRDSILSFMENTLIFYIRYIEPCSFMMKSSHTRAFSIDRIRSYDRNFHIYYDKDSSFFILIVKE